MHACWVCGLIYYLYVFVPLQQSQHLSNLSRDDHSFIGRIESRSRQGTPSQPLNSLPTLGPQHNYTGDQPRQLHTPIGDGTPLSQHPQYGDTLTQNMLQQNLMNGSGYSSHTAILEGERVQQYSSSSQGGRQTMPLNHHHSQSYTNVRNSDSNSSGLVIRGADTRNPVDSMYMYDQHQPQQWATGEFNQMMSSSTGSHAYNGASTKTVAQCQWSAPVYNGDRHAEMNGTSNATPTNNIYLTTSTSTGEVKYNRQPSSASSGYGTASSTERYSVVSMLSREQSLGEICENSLQVKSTPQRKISAPPNYNSSHPRTRKMPSQQSHSLTNLSQDIPEYPYDNEENEHHEGEECEGHPSLQRQDTGHAAKVVFAGLEDSIDRERYQSVMGSKRKMPKQNAVDEGMQVFG